MGIIKINDVRCGNVFLIFGLFPRQVKSVATTGLVMFDNGRIEYVENLTPIILTNEILTKLGFRVSNHSFKHDIGTVEPTYAWVKDGVYINKADSDESRIFAWEQYDDAYLVIECRYLHQLQNAFYSITGEELDVKNILGELRRYYKQKYT